MKKTLLNLALLTALVAPAAQATETSLQAQQTQAQKVQQQKQHQKEGVAAGSFMAGALAAGPIGAIVGGIAGVWLGDKVEEAYLAREDATQLEQELAVSQARLEQTRMQLAEAERESTRYAQAVFDQLQLELSFRTGVAALPKTSEQRLDYLAQFMINNPRIHIRLDGYADPRGSQDYNQALSARRVQWVAEQLIQRGVAAIRMDTAAHGEQYSAAAKGDVDGYALERVVKIELSDERQKASVAKH